MEKEEFVVNEDHSIWILQDIKKVLQELYDHYRSVSSQNDYLRKEIERIKDEKYKDEELSKLKKEYDRMHDEYYRGFGISEEESKKIKEWMDKVTEGEDLQQKIGGAIGGRFYYEFRPTSIGTIGTIIDSFSGEKFTFQELY